MFGFSLTQPTKLLHRAEKGKKERERRRRRQKKQNANWELEDMLSAQISYEIFDALRLTRLDSTQLNSTRTRSGSVGPRAEAGLGPSLGLLLAHCLVTLHFPLCTLHSPLCIGQRINFVTFL